MSSRFGQTSMKTRKIIRVNSVKDSNLGSTVGSYV